MVERGQGGRLQGARGQPGPAGADARQVLHQDRGRLRAEAEIRSWCDFSELNLIGAWPAFPTFDIVFLRNVLIYFDVDTKRTIIGRVKRLLAPDGYLFLGAAETTMNIDDGFERLPARTGGLLPADPMILATGV